MSEPFLINGSGGAVDQLGVIAAEQVWEVDDEPTCVSFTTGHPLNIPILERQWREQPHGKWHLSLKFEGVNDVDSSDGKAIYEGDSGESEDPIESYPGISLLTAAYPQAAGSPTSDGRIVWSQMMTDQNGKSVPNPMFGVDSYAVSYPTWTERKLYAQLPNDLYQYIDHTFQSPPGNPPAPPPNNDSPNFPQRNWLLRRIVPRQRGNIWEVQSTWQLSGPGGWNIYIYSASGS